MPTRYSYTTNRVTVTENRNSKTLHFEIETSIHDKKRLEVLLEHSLSALAKAEEAVNLMSEEELTERHSKFRTHRLSYVPANP